MARLTFNDGKLTGERQLSFDDLGPGLDEVTFVVVDLETTGQRPGAEEITEIGAVKSRGGQRIGEFATLVNPNQPIPPTITHLTGITTAMVMEAPRISRVLPAFLEFLGSGDEVVLVAHNARFDVGHLKAAAHHMDIPFPHVTVLDTVALARRLISRDETPNYKLGSLATVVGAVTKPSHRALDDARATEELLQFLLGRMGSLGATHAADLASITDVVPARRRQRSHLAHGLTRGPGVYRFIGPGDEVLYVGTSTKVYQRVRQYFTAAEKRRRIGDMVDLAQRVEATPTSTPIEARILELRLIEEYDPPFNRRSRKPRSKPYLALTDEAFPRLTVVRRPTDTCLGPFPSQRAAQNAKTLIERVTHIRTCSLRISPRGTYSPCSRLDMGLCDGVCVTKSEQPALNTVTGILDGRVNTAVTATLEHLSELSEREEFERAADERNQLNDLLAAAHRSQRTTLLTQIPSLIAARKESDRWSVILVRCGRLVSSATCELHEVTSTAEFLATLSGDETEPTAEEISLLYEWICRPGTRLIGDIGPLMSMKRSSALQYRLTDPKSA